MNKTFRVGALAAIAATVMFVGAPAFATSYLFETATPGGAASSGAYPVFGDGTDIGSSYWGTTFAVTGNSISSLLVGANVDDSGAGTGSIFAEIVPVASLSSVPNATAPGITTWLQSNSLGSVLIAAPSGPGNSDATGVINFSTALAAGNYALIFGSGLYGATGNVSLTDGNTTNGTPNIFSALASNPGDTFTPPGYDTGIRMFAAPVPLPAALPLLGSGLAAGLAFVRRRRRPIQVAA